MPSHLEAALLSIETLSAQIIAIESEMAASGARGKRVVALARKMAGVLYAMWRDGQPYQPQLTVRPPDARGLSSGDSTA